MYTERYMDTPELNFDGYSKANLLNYIANLEGKLLLVHGTLDPVVVWQHTLQYAKKAAENNVPLDYYPYPGNEHHMMDMDKSSRGLSVAIGKLDSAGGAFGAILLDASPASFRISFVGVIARAPSQHREGETG